MWWRFGEHLTDAEIVAEILNDGEQEEEDAETIVEVDDESANPPSSQEIESAIDTLDRSSLFCDNGDIKHKVDSLAKEMPTLILARKRQTSIECYFSWLLAALRFLSVL